MADDVNTGMRGVLRKLAGSVRARAATVAGSPARPVVHLLHIRKTGGTAVKHTLVDHPPAHLDVRLHGHKVRLADVPVGEQAMFFVRDPISRFVSGFYSRQRQGRPRYDVPWTPGEKAAFERFSTPNALALALGADDPEAKGAATRAIEQIRHTRTKARLTAWLDSEEYLRSRAADLFFIGFQESLAEDFERLRRKLGLPEHTRLPSDEVNAHRNPDGLDRHLNETAVRNLKDWYARDYEIVEACRALAARINRSPVSVEG